MAEDTLPMEVQQQIQRLQALSAQLQAVAQQRAQMELLEGETRRAKDAVSGLADDAPLYRSVGSLLLKDSKPSALSRLDDEAETMAVRLKRLKEQEETLTAELESLQDSLQKALQA